MDKKDEQILDIMKGNARISFQELGEKLGISRVAAMKRVRKLEEAGIIRQYNTCIYRDDRVTMMVDIVVKPGREEKVLKYLTGRTAYICQLFRMNGEGRFHIVAVAPTVEELNYLLRMIQKKCEEDLADISVQAVKEIIKDVYGGVGNERKDRTNSQ